MLDPFRSFDSPEVPVKIELDLSDFGFRFDPDNPDANGSLTDLVVAEAARVLVDQINFDAPIQRTTGWNEKQGDPMSITEMIRVELERFLSDWKPTERSNYSSDKTPRNLGDLIAEVSKHILATELRADIEKIRREVGVKVQDIAIAAAAEALTKASR